MADSTNQIIKIALIAAGAYVIYEYVWPSLSASLGIGGGTPTTPTTPTSPTLPPPSGPVAPATPPSQPPSTPAAPTWSGPSLQAIYTQMQQLANADWAVSHPCNVQSNPGTGPSMIQPVINPPMVRPGVTRAMAGLGAVFGGCTIPAAQFGMDAWNSYAVSAGGPNPMPDPMLAFPGVDRSTLMTAQTYWNGMRPLLVKQGLSGMAAYYRARKVAHQNLYGRAA